MGKPAKVNDASWCRLNGVSPGDEVVVNHTVDGVTFDWQRRYIVTAIGNRTILIRELNRGRSPEKASTNMCSRHIMRPAKIAQRTQ